MRRHTPLALLFVGAALASLVALSGCGGGAHPSGARDGILWISWTVRGQPVSEATCKSVDHLTLTMDGPGGALSIEPIPCLRGLGWEYDGLPEGNSFVQLDGYDTNGFVTLEGATTVAVTATRAAMPAPVDLLTTR
jgi:hypothetical protein